MEDKKLIEFEGLFAHSVHRLLPKGKLGILFSGGIDSSLVALVSKKLGAKPVLYTSAFESANRKSRDLEAARKVAKELNLELRVANLSLDEAEFALKKIIPVIKTTDVVQVGVALAIYSASKLAAQDGIKVMFSGAGSDELFAGYSRFQKSDDLNKDCLAALKKLKHTDLLRDIAVLKMNKIESRAPFLDKKIIDFALNLGSDYKLGKNQTKLIVRQLARKLGFKEALTERKKCAAQYGSGTDYAILKLAKRAGFRNKSEYLYTFYKKPNLLLAGLASSGKDSTYAMQIVTKQNYKINCLVSIVSENPDSFMYHTPNIGLVKLQAKAMGLPLITKKTKGKKEAELSALKSALVLAKKKYKVQGVVVGAIESRYQSERVQAICDKLKLKVFAPLWHKNQENEIRECINSGMKFILVKVAAQGLDKSWLGREITHKDVDKLVEINRKIGINIAGEGGEFESLVLDSPLFKKKISIKNYEITDKGIVSVMNIKKAELLKK